MEKEKIGGFIMFRKSIHKLIVRYLLKCGGCFHTGPYGERGAYVALFSDREYGEYQHLLTIRDTYEMTITTTKALLERKGQEIDKLEKRLAEVKEMHSRQLQDNAILVRTLQMTANEIRVSEHCSEEGLQ
jgi:hypothetical protein